MGRSTAFQARSHAGHSGGHTGPQGATRGRPGALGLEAAARVQSVGPHRHVAVAASQAFWLEFPVRLVGARFWLFSDVKLKCS